MNSYNSSQMNLTSSHSNKIHLKEKMARTSTITDLAKESFLDPKFIRDEDERPKVAYNDFSTEIPVISLAGIEEHGSKRDEICNKIVSACEEWGIFQVVDHGINLKLMDDMSRQAKEFFALPAQEKLHYDMSGGKKGGFIVSSHLQVFSYKLNCPYS